MTLGSALAELAGQRDAYPSERPKTRTHSFLVDSDADLAAAVQALSALANPDARCRIVGNPDKSAVLPKSGFLVVEAPVNREAKEVVAALRKASKRVDRLTCTAFDGEPTLFATGKSIVRPDTSS